ncbi:hypothetical protein N0V90_006455 [Kalmusia sp. IMI 367209]|nr:hypothetical protein N0V90_006455 [Kalmusia sp. IMI 367209]
MAPPKPKGKKTTLNNTSPDNKDILAHGIQELRGRSPAIDNQKTNILPILWSPDNHVTDPPSISFSRLESLPVEVSNHIFSYLVRPRSRLPGLSERESSYDSGGQRSVKDREDLQAPPDADRFAADLFSWPQIRHPFNSLAATSRHCRDLVESYCYHLVKTCNRFNLPFAEAERHGAHSVYPNLSGIVYRRLWLQTAPRDCVFCGVIMSYYPHRGYRLMLSCEGCFLAQALTFEEVRHQYHIMNPAILAAHNVRGAGHKWDWVLRVDVETLALKLYGTRAFHDTTSLGLYTPCKICKLAGTNLSPSAWSRPRLMPSHVTKARTRFK